MLTRILDLKNNRILLASVASETLWTMLILKQYSMQADGCMYARTKIIELKTLFDKAYPDSWSYGMAAVTETA